MPDDCADNCRWASGCVAWSYRKSRYECYLHTSNRMRERETGWISGETSSTAKYDSYKYEDPNLITSNYIPGISELFTK